MFRISSKSNFGADKLNQKWFMDETGFFISAEKVYLAPIIGCYGGMRFLEIYNHS